MPRGGVEALGGPQRGELALCLLLSASAHVVLGILLAGHFPAGPATLPAVIAVELVAPPAAAGRREPVPVPAPVPAPAVVKPRPAEPKKVLLPKQSRQEPAKAVQPAKPKPRPVETKPAQPKEYDDVLAELRKEAGEQRPEPTQVAAVIPPAGVPVERAGPAGAPVSPEVAAWIRQAKQRVRAVWVVTAGFRTQELEAELSVELDASGQVLGEPQLLRRSGNPWYDEQAVRGIQKASPLPPPPEPGRWSFVLNSWEDSP